MTDSYSAKGICDAVGHNPCGSQGGHICYFPNAKEFGYLVTGMPKHCPHFHKFQEQTRLFEEETK